MKKFDLSTTHDSVGDLTVSVVTVEGFLDSSTFPQLQGHLESLIEQGHFCIVVELGNLNYISSAGIGVLMGMLQEVRSHDGDLKLANMSSKIKNLFDMLGFSRLIRIYDDVETARQSFSTDRSNSQNDSPTPAEENY